MEKIGDFATKGDILISKNMGRGGIANLFGAWNLGILFCETVIGGNSLTFAPLLETMNNKCGGRGGEEGDKIGIPINKIGERLEIAAGKRGGNACMKCEQICVLVSRSAYV